MQKVSLNFRIFHHDGGKAQLGESPCWDPLSHDLWWVDVTGKRLLRADTQSGDIQTWDTPECAGFVVLTASGRPALGMQTGIFSFDPNGGSFERLIRFDQAGCRFNDATVDQNGQLWVSTMAMDAQKNRGAVHRVTKNRGLETIASGLTIPNGLALDLDRERLFYSESLAESQMIWVRSLTPDPERLGEPTSFVDTQTLAGRPDGAALDRQGCYWIAGVDGSELYIFDPQGGLKTTVSVPFTAPTKVSFSGPTGRLIAVTSKTDKGDGGYIALATLAPDMAAGVAQPYWNPDAW